MHERRGGGGGLRRCKTLCMLGEVKAAPFAPGLAGQPRYPSMQCKRPTAGGCKNERCRGGSGPLLNRAAHG